MSEEKQGKREHLVVCHLSAGENDMPKKWEKRGKRSPKQKNTTVSFLSKLKLEQNMGK